MDIMTWLEAAFRWIHVVAGVLWIGHLYFFNFVNAQVAKTYDADSKKKVLPELMPRALYWFRWGAAYTWVTGILLATLVYYHASGALAYKNPATDAAAISHMGAMWLSLALVVVVFFVYDGLWKALGKNENTGVAVLLVLWVVVLFVLSRFFTGRALFIHEGMLFGTIMAMNVWMRIWPAQRQIIQGVKGVAPAPDPSVPAGAAMRSKHNTYMSVALLFTMVSNHYPTIYGSDHAWIALAVITGVAFLAARWLYGKSASAAPAGFGAPAAAPAPKA
jgi:uncharacterized membrane protein